MRHQVRYRPGQLRFPAGINSICLRMEFPEMSLRELGEALEKPIGRSGANHRLKRISEFADKLREEYGEND